MKARVAVAALLSAFALVAGCGGRGGLSVSFDVQSPPPSPPSPPAPPGGAEAPPLTWISLAYPGPYRAGDRADVKVAGRPGQNVVVRLGDDGAPVPLKEDPASPGSYEGQIDLTGVSPGRYTLVAEAEGADQIENLRGAAVLEVIPSSSPTPAILEGLRPVYFETGRWDLTPESLATVEADAKVLLGAGDFHGTVEGHADERGSDSYDYVLGIWRAKTVKDALRSLGVDPARLTLVSHGKGRPAVEGSDQAAMARNRRVEIVARSPR